MIRRYKLYSQHWILLANPENNALFSSSFKFFEFEDHAASRLFAPISSARANENANHCQDERRAARQFLNAGTRRGFVLTLDALLAVLLLLMAVALLGTEWFRPLAPDGLYLKQVSFDTLYILESTGRLDRAVGGNATAVREVFEGLPKHVCMQLAIENVGGASIATIARLDCGSYHRELQTAYGTFIYEGEIYKTRLESWYRKET